MSELSDEISLNTEDTSQEICFGNTNRTITGVSGNPEALITMFKKAQISDAFFGPIIKLMLNATNITLMNDLPPLAVKLVDQFLLNANSVLTKLSYKTEKLLICVPASLVSRILMETHDLPSVGHLGITKTIMRTKAGYWWSSLVRDVVHYVNYCTKCLSHKQPHTNPRHALGKLNLPLDVFQRVHMDIWTPDGTTKDGFTSVLGVIDAFSKYLILIPLKTHTAKDVVNALMHYVFLIYGTHETLISDGAQKN